MNTAAQGSEFTGRREGGKTGVFLFLSSFTDSWRAGRPLVSRREFRSLPASLLLAALLGAVACGPATPKPEAVGSGAPSSSASSEPVATAAPSDSGAAEAGAAGCLPKCAEHIAGAIDLLAQADGLGSAPNVALVYGRAGDAFVYAWRSCDLRLPAGSDRSCKGASEVVPGMVKAYAGSGRSDRMVLAYLVALDRRWSDPSSELGRQAPDALRGLAERVEQAAQGKKLAPGAPEALYAAGYARLALGDASSAERDLELFQKLPGPKGADDVALLSAAIAARYAEDKAWDRALARLTLATEPGSAAQPRAKILWHAERGRALCGAGRASSARADFGEVLRLWGPDGPKEPAAAIGHALPAPMLDRESVVDAVGSAHFFLAEQKAELAKQLAMPAYKGPATVKGVNDYWKTTLAEWLGKRQQAVLDAQNGYAPIRALKPVPPARWVAAAAARTGQLWVDFAAALTGGAMPAPVAADPELKGAWERATADTSRQLLDQARTAFEACRKVAADAGLSDERTQACEQWLAAAAKP